MTAERSEPRELYAETMTREEEQTEVVEMNQQKVAQIYVRSEDDDDEMEQQKDHNVTDENYNSIAEQFAMPKELKESMNESQAEMGDTSSEFTYNSVGQYYRAQLAKDITSCSKVPSVLLEIVSSILSIVNIAIAYVAFHEISYETTGIRYKEYAANDAAMYHGGDIRQYFDNVNWLTYYIYQEPVFLNWRNFVHLGLSLIVIEFLPPLLRIVIVTNRAPKKINTLHSLVQISVLTAVVLEDGAVSLCKNMLFADECGIRPAMMSRISQLSASLCFVNATFKSVLFVWRSSYRTERAVRDEMEAYTEILILEEYQWYHCIIPILAHIAVICISAWSLIDATTEKLICTT